MTTKTNPVALPIALLRSIGCRVGTVIGHDPTASLHPEWRYGVTLPDGITTRWATASTNTVIGDAVASVAYDGRIIAEGTNAPDVAKLLTALYRVLSQKD